MEFCGECGTQLPPPKDHHPLVTETLQTPVHELTTGSSFAGLWSGSGRGRVVKNPFVYDI